MKYVILLLGLCLSSGCQAILLPEPELQQQEDFVPPSDFAESEQRLAQIERELSSNKLQFASILEKDSVDLLEVLYACRLLTTTLELADEAANHCEYIAGVYRDRAALVRESAKAFELRLQKNRGKPIMQCRVTRVAQNLFRGVDEFKAKKDEQQAQLYADMSVQYRGERKELTIAFLAFRESLK